MHGSLLSLLICPSCLPAEYPLHLAETPQYDGDGDILTGQLHCHHCRRAYPIEDGLATVLPPGTSANQPEAQDKYLDAHVVSAYLWSSFGDLMEAPGASDAYAQWAAMVDAGPGPGLDVGCAVGRSTMEMAANVGFSVGIDLSPSFMRTARQLHRHGSLCCELREQGRRSRPFTVTLPPRLREIDVEFLVADAMALPFRSDAFPSVTAFNVMDKLPDPLQHLRELERMLSASNATLIVADPFSWSEAITPPERWIGGLEEGPLAGWSETVLPKVLRSDPDIADALAALGGGLRAPLTVVAQQSVPWILRNHRHHAEHIHSQTWKAAR